MPPSLIGVPNVVSIAVGITLEGPLAILAAWNATSSVKPETKSKPPGRDGSACYASTIRVIDDRHDQGRFGAHRRDHVADSK
jgi:hypothetical protein